MDIVAIGISFALGCVVMGIFMVIINIRDSKLDDASASDETKRAREDISKYLWSAVPLEEAQMYPTMFHNHKPGALIACSTKDYEELRKGTYVVKNCAFCGGTGIGPNDLPNGMVWICGTCAEMREDVKNTILKRTEKLDKEKM